ncbi:hypothetical protein [Clostridium paridis]|uniref:Uncharacterized protein n=1 Tax=Clostridium paridis TaxID=2803863 RepID=A0A937K4X7_9CLOT|nr:hypothetical protein [Clostridium paridis]MBL4932369.1 hypothetical protein [Clostridium paridis]
MNIDWYVFEESYLTDIDYRICENILRLVIDGRFSIDHPRSEMVKEYEDYFEEIEIVFSGVQYYRGICSKRINKCPKDDRGNVEYFHIGGSNTIEDGIRLEFETRGVNIFMDNDNKFISRVFSESKDIKFVEFISEMVAFRAVFEDYKINVIE